MAARRGHEVHQGLAWRQRRKLVDGAAATRDAELWLGGPRARSHAAVADKEFQSPWRPIGAGDLGRTAIVRGRTLCRHRSIPKWTRDHSSRRQHSAGGWRLSGQPATVRRFISKRPECLVQRNAKTGPGDALRMAQEAGATLPGTDRFDGHLLVQEALKNEGPLPYPTIVSLAGTPSWSTGLAAVSSTRASAESDVQRRRQLDYPLTRRRFSTTRFGKPPAASNSHRRTHLWSPAAARCSRRRIHCTCTEGWDSRRRARRNYPHL